MFMTIVELISMIIEDYMFTFRDPMGHQHLNTFIF